MIHHQSIKKLLIISCLFFVSLLKLQAVEFSALHYGVEDGLLSSNIYCIYQDTKGYIWISTSAGINRFDGEKFTSFTAKNGVNNSRITSIHEDVDGSLWFKTRGVTTLMKYDGRKFTNVPIHKDKVQIYGIGTSSSQQSQTEPLWIKENDMVRTIHPTINVQLKNHKNLQHNYIYSMHILGDEHYYIGTSLGLIEYQNGTYVNHTKKIGLTTQIHRIIPYQDRYLLQTDEGIQYFDGQNFSNEGIHPHLHRNVTNVMALDKNGLVWFSTIKGLYKFDGQDFTRYTTEDGLPYNRTNYLYIDRKNNIWVSTEKGMVVYDGVEFVGVDTEETGYMINGLTRGFRYRQVLEDKEGNIWFDHAKGVTKFFGFAFKNYRYKKDLNEKGRASSVLLDSEDKLWIGYYGTGITTCKNDSCWNLKDQFPDLEVPTRVNDFIAFPSNSNTDAKKIWIATAEGLQVFDGKKFTSLNFDKDDSEKWIDYFRQDSKGNIWFASQQQVYCYNIATQGFEKYIINQLDRPFSTYFYLVILDLLVDKQDRVWASSIEGIFRLDKAGNPKSEEEAEAFTLVGGPDYFDNVYDMAEDEQGNIWMLRELGGMMRFDGSHIIEFDEMDGLSNNNLKSIEILDGCAWIGTVNGIDQLNVDLFNKEKKIQVQHIGKNEGFTNIECWRMSYQDHYGKMWFNTRDGITNYNPKLHNITPPNQDVLISSIKLGYETIDWVAYADSVSVYDGLPVDLSLEHNENTLTFHFKSITFSNNEHLQYRYQLAGLDTVWHSTHQALATYPNLAHGDYVFNVKTANSSSKDAIASFSFTIQPPVWYQAWFWACMFIFGLVALLAYWILHYLIFKHIFRGIRKLFDRNRTEVIA